MSTWSEPPLPPPFLAMPLFSLQWLQQPIPKLKHVCNTQGLFLNCSTEIKGKHQNYFGLVEFLWHIDMKWAIYGSLWLTLWPHWLSPSLSATLWLFLAHFDL